MRKIDGSLLLQLVKMQLFNTVFSTAGYALFDSIHDLQSSMHTDFVSILGFLNGKNDF